MSLDTSSNMGIPNVAAPDSNFGVSVRMILWILLPVLTLGYLFWDAFIYLFAIWTTDENYGHGIFVPVISAYLIWQQRSRLRERDGSGTWFGFGLVLVGMGLYLVGELATLYFLLHLSFWVMGVGFILAFWGYRVVKRMAFPLAFLLTAIPLPQFFIQTLSAKLQLISSQLGVGCLQVVGIVAFREGNVIDLGPIQLQVVEACSGLRALFPLMTLALICAYFFKDRMWKRITLFLSSIPIAIFLNGIRIGIVGMLVDGYGVGFAEGFYHFFEGWVIFVLSLFLLLLEMWVLAGLGNHGTSRISPNPQSAGLSTLPHRIASLPDRGPGNPGSSMAYVCSLFLLVPFLVASTQISAREEIVPARTSFLDFPMEVGIWRGQAYPMEQAFIDTLRFDDYLLADYQQGTDPPINLYLAYYQSQKKGQSVHSPRTCIPGGGWEIESLEAIRLDGMKGANPSLWVNRVMIHKGAQRQLVYYWFQQRGRIMTNEYLVKWFLLWDGLTHNRTDGALVRVTVPIASGADIEASEGALHAFVKSLSPVLPDYIPDGPSS
jgi:exosortase D (VPLPA-CTERM-specific)